MSPSPPSRAKTGQHDRTREVRHERRARRGRELARRALLHHLAGVDDPHTVAELSGLGEVVRHEQRWRLALAEHLGEHACRPRPGAGVERGQRLVEQQHSGFRREGSREGDSLPLPAAEAVRARLRAALEAEALEQLE